MSEAWRQFTDNRLRWRATVVYRTDAGETDVEHLLAELDDLHAVVEAGPHWDCIIRIEIVRHKPIEAGLTLEAAERL